MLLAFLHKVGLTNLTDEQVSRFQSLPSTKKVDIIPVTWMVRTATAVLFLGVLTLAIHAENSASAVRDALHATQMQLDTTQADLRKSRQDTAEAQDRFQGMVASLGRSQAEVAKRLDRAETNLEASEQALAVTNKELEAARKEVASIRDQEKELKQKLDQLTKKQESDTNKLQDLLEQQHGTLKKHDAELVDLKKRLQALAIKFPERQEGMIREIRGNKIDVSTNKDELREYTVPSGTTITLDWEKTTLDKLTPKMRVRITLRPGESSEVSRIDALKEKKEFDPK